jgi:hypothetical protein
MAVHKNLRGSKFGRWLVIGDPDPALAKGASLCRCDCGAEKVVDHYNLTSGRSRSCRKCSAKASAPRTHGLSRTKVYMAWQSMKTRCYNERSSRSYAYHGALGVRVWDGWLSDFQSFYAHVGDPPTPLHTIDRIDPDGDYAPGNVRWATQYEQRHNRRGVV